jgi:hypothetical protein
MVMIKNIIGLGHAGCTIADCFEEREGYVVYRINTEGLDLKNNKNFLLKKQNDPENYERYPPNLQKFFRQVCEPCLFIVGGSGIISSAALVILEQLKHVPTHILYVCPDRSFLGKQDAMVDRLTFGALQEMTRSGLFERFWIVSNPTIEQISDGIPIGKYFNVLNETIVSTFHAINYYSNREYIAGSFEDLPLGTRISTIGVVNNENEDCLFFPLDSITDKQYVYVCSDQTLNSDRKLMNKIKNNVLEKNNPDEDGISSRVSFVVCEGEQDFTYVVSHTSFIQEI